MAVQEKRFKHVMICDCGAKLEMVAVTKYEEGGFGKTEQTIEGEEWVCTVTPNDGSIDGPSDSASVTVVSGDSDGDGVPDFEDLCPGYDDSIDANGNGIPDGCEVYEVFLRARCSRGYRI